MWVRAVVRMTPPPKQERQDTTNPPLEPSDTSTCNNTVILHLPNHPFGQKTTHSFHMGSTHLCSMLAILHFKGSSFTADLFSNKHRNETDKKRDQSKDAHGDNFGGKQVHLEVSRLTLSNLKIWQLYESFPE